MDVRTDTEQPASDDKTKAPWWWAGTVAITIARIKFGDEWITAITGLF